MKTKQIAYSYPTSPNARKFKLRNGGYCVEMVRHDPERQPPIAIAGFATKEQAKSFADTLSEQYDVFSIA